MKNWLIIVALIFFNMAFVSANVRVENAIDTVSNVELDIAISEEVTISGTLSSPVNADTVVILITGSGPQDRNSELLGHKPFLDIATYLNANGIAVFRYDERGVGKSTGVYKNATTEDLKNDAKAILQFIKDRGEFKTYGIIGHSEGGLIAPMIASETNVDFIITIGGPTMPCSELMLLQKKLVEESMGIDPSNVATGQRIMGEAYEMIKSNTKPVKKLRKKLTKYFEKEFDVDEMTALTITGQLTGTWMYYFLRIDPTEIITKAAENTRFYAIYGSTDLQVPSKENEEALKQLAPNAQTVVLQNHNHLMQYSETGKISEYSTIDHAISEQALQQILIAIRS